MNKMVSKLALAAGLVLALAFMASCVGDDSSAFVGKWITEDGSSAPSGLPDNLELFKDGTGIVDGTSISWKVENKRFVISYSLKGSAFDYEISGRILTLTADNGRREIYIRPQEEKIEGKDLIDNRDGKKYKTVIIGTQTWMAENLNYKAEGSNCYGEGGEVATDYDDKGNITATKTLSDKEVLNNCAKYGRLYDWSTAKETCPSGWHLPSKTEWTKLTGFIGGNKTAGKKLKSSSGWSENGNGTDRFGFSALPGGYGYSDGNFNNVSYGGDWWGIISNSNSDIAYHKYMYYRSEGTHEDDYDMLRFFSVRCVRDSEPTQEPTLVGAIIPLLLVIGMWVAIFLVLKKFLKFFFRKIKLRTGKGVIRQMNTEETKKKNFRHIVKGCAFVLCVLFFVCPLVKCSANSSLTASGWEIATGTGELFSEEFSKESSKGNPLVFALIIIPTVLLILAFANKSFIVLRNVSIAGLAAKIIFMIAVHIKLSSGYYKGAFELTGSNWLIVFIYAGLIGFTQYCIKQEEIADEDESVRDTQ
jgi:uncharacterized protein (TIGR02145 family)